MNIFVRRIVPWDGVERPINLTRWDEMKNVFGNPMGYGQQCSKTKKQKFLNGRETINRAMIIPRVIEN